MQNKTIRNKIMNTLIKLEAPLVTIVRLKGIKQTSEGVSVHELYVAMGECTGAEFEAIKRMREEVEINYNISICNVLIDL